MSQNNIDQSQAAETLTQETRTFIRQVRSATRRKYAPEDKIRIVLDGFRRELTEGTMKMYLQPTYVPMIRFRKH